MRVIIFDWKRTLYDPEGQRLIDGALDVLALALRSNVESVLVGKGGADMYDEVDRLGVRKYFSSVYFQEGTKEETVFKRFIYAANPSNTIFVGDRIRSELRVGNKLDATTIWVKQGKFSNELPENENDEPNYTVKTLRELSDILNELLAD